MHFLYIGRFYLNVTYCMEKYRKKQTQKQLFTIISRGFVTPLQDLTVISII